MDRPYLRDNIVSVDKEEVKKIMYQVANYTLMDEVLYKRGTSLPLLRYLRLEESVATTLRAKRSICTLSGSAIVGYITS